MSSNWSFAKAPIGVLAGMLAVCASSGAMAAPADDLNALRDAISNLRQDYETKIRDLESRLQKAEADAAIAKAAADAAQSAALAPAPAAAAAPVAPRAPTPTNAFNPSLAAVLNGTFNGASRDSTEVFIPGFPLGGDAGGPERGFSLGESEVSLSANVDPFFSAATTLSFGNDSSVGVEEAYIQSGSLGDGITLKAGRFFSGIGYLNERHAHNWTFSDMSLAYRAMLNTQLGDDGVQARWLAPANIFLEFGAEWLRGDAFPASGSDNQGKGTVTAFVHAGDDINDSSSWLAGLSYLHTRSDERESGGVLFNGSDNVGIVSLVYKWAPGGNLINQNLTLSGEYFFARESGVFDGIDTSLNRTAWYVQGAFQFMPRWSIGLRYSQLHAGRAAAGLRGSIYDGLGRTPNAESALIEFDTSEFARLRLQYNHDESGLKPLDQVLLQYTIVFGPHDAHRY